MAHYIGLMSGTSLDGIDGVLVDEGVSLPVRAHVQHPLAAALRRELSALNEAGENELHRAALAANAIAQGYAGVVADLLCQASLKAADVRAIGAHGQTVRHRPGAFDSVGYTLQLLNGALLAELTGIEVVCDLRGRDLAAGGQGAPLVPAFHAERFGDPERDIAVLNLGGIANLTLLPAGRPVSGFDCGPGNLLLDLWCQQHIGEPFDRDGAWASTGQSLSPLLRVMLADAYFGLPPPKSTGRDHFHRAWLERAVACLPLPPAAPDVQATLLELTARAACESLERHAGGTQTLVVCGGGAFNGALLTRLRALLPSVEVLVSDALGLGAEQVEAAAFAWLAKARVSGAPGNLPEVTGARGPRVLGVIHPG